MSASNEIIILLMFAAFFAGFIDSIAGGGGLVTVPVLLIAGLPPLQALATNKLQGLFGAGSAAYTYAKAGHVDLKKQFIPAVLSGLAACLGAVLITLLPSDNIRLILPVLLIAIALFFWFKPGLDDVDRAQRMTPLIFMATIVPLIGFYDGFFGPGTGSFFMLAFVTLSGFGILKATAHTKLLNFASNIGGFLVLALAGAVVWKLGLLMGIAQFAGAQLGARLAMKQGARIIKPLLTLTCIALAAKLLFDQYY
ncbi:TSUP family transporter [Ahrensia marina]|uniref:Probable membrane transporter protein n=1 Tax=Ahrensia marina TaxID=1514904 RepID=A0A0N0E8V4_9HYPH|nr:TSUP family transporter [Ahrensia marina]KPB02791.1 membrane protein [Ahrensia marina]